MVTKNFVVVSLLIDSVLEYHKIYIFYDSFVEIINYELIDCGNK
jgi:hypothetical protein